MKLAEYMVMRGTSQADLARFLKVSPPTVHNWIYKKQYPCGMSMMRLYKWSGGKVGLKDWCEDFNV